MEVMVQQIEGKLFRGTKSEWTASREDAMVFATALDAIGFCVRFRMREIRLIGQDKKGRDVYLYPFGGDPTVRAELKTLRRGIRESRRLKRERRLIQARMDMLMAEGKEKKKQFPFKRGSVAGE